MKGVLLHPTTLHMTGEQKDLLVCLLLALVGILFGLTLVYQIQREPAVALANSPIPAEIQR